MTRVEGENTRLRHYLARLHRKTLCYSKSEEMMRHVVTSLLEIWGCLNSCLIPPAIQQRRYRHSAPTTFEHLDAGSTTFVLRCGHLCCR
jgi:hypothetical protein